MHGRKKPTSPRSESETTALQKKTQQASGMIALVLGKKKANDMSEETLELTGKVLRSLTDFYSVWNFRRRILISMTPELALLESKGAVGERDIPVKLVNAELVRRELQLSEDGIRKNPKSYGAWHHRLWILQRFQVDYANELQLCKLLLTEDQRNFHCWCYRRFVVSVGAIGAAEEFAYSTEKIEENFSNYSAFHHRSVFIRQLDVVSMDSSSSSGNSSGGDKAIGDYEGKRQLIEEEFNLVENAIYTEPDDQSAWWYHQFLVTWSCQQCKTVTAAGSSSSGTGSGSGSSGMWQWYGELLQRQAAVMRELLAVEADSKWAMTSLVVLLTSLIQVRALSEEGGSGSAGDSAGDSVGDSVGGGRGGGGSSSGSGSGSGSEDVDVDEGGLDEERRCLLERLCVIDSDHEHRYRHLLSSTLGS